jgi:hypothetical protein
MTDDIDELAATLAKTGWADKPKGMGFTPEEQGMANALLRDWDDVPAPTPEAFEWAWTSNTLGRSWQVVRREGTKRYLVDRGFTQDSLERRLKSLRANGHTVRQTIARTRTIR